MAGKKRVFLTVRVALPLICILVGVYLALSGGLGPKAPGSPDEPREPDTPSLS